MDLKLLLMKTGHHRGFNGTNLHIVKKKKHESLFRCLALQMKSMANFL